MGAGRATTHLGAPAAVLDVIRASGTTSRADLVHITGLTGATISTAVRRLIDDGLVVETGRAESTGGKPRVLLQLNHAARFAIGVHLDHSGIVYVLTTLGGTVVGRMSRAGAGVEDPPAVIARMSQEVDALVDSSGVDRDRVLGLGLVSPGPLTPSAGMRLTPPAMRKWVDFPLDRAVQEAIGVPVLLENDATAAALGEHWTGRAGTRSTFAALYMGTGIGAGLIINGAAYGGVSGNAGEIGHLCLDPEGPECWCGARGCTEALGGPASVVAAASTDPDLLRRAGLDGSPSDPERAEVAHRFASIARLALRGDAQARGLLEASAQHVALATRALANVMDIDLVVLTGPSMAVAGSVYVPVVQAELDRSFFSRSTHGVRVMVSASARTSAAIGAAAMVLQSHLVPHGNGPALP